MAEFPPVADTTAAARRSSPDSRHADLNQDALNIEEIRNGTRYRYLKPSGENTVEEVLAILSLHISSHQKSEVLSNYLLSKLNEVLRESCNLKSTNLLKDLSFLICQGPVLGAPLALNVLEILLARMPAPFPGILGDLKYYEEILTIPVEGSNYNPEDAVRLLLFMTEEAWKENQSSVAAAFKQMLNGEEGKFIRLKVIIFFRHFGNDLTVNDKLYEVFQAGYLLPDRHSIEEITIWGKFIILSVSSAPAYIADPSFLHVELFKFIMKEATLESYLNILHFFYQTISNPAESVSPITAVLLRCLHNSNHFSFVEALEVILRTEVDDKAIVSLLDNLEDFSVMHVWLNNRSKLTNVDKFSSRLTEAQTFSRELLIHVLRKLLILRPILVQDLSKKLWKSLISLLAKDSREKEDILEFLLEFALWNQHNPSFAELLIPSAEHLRRMASGNGWFKLARTMEVNFKYLYSLHPGLVPSSIQLGRLGEVDRAQLAGMAAGHVRRADMTRDTATTLAGLDNLGNTCYANSVVQALFNNQQFRSVVLAAPVTMTSRQPLLLSLQSLFQCLQQSLKHSVCPRRFLQRSQPSWFEHGQQQDCDEFLNVLLNSLSEESAFLEKPGEDMEVEEDDALAILLNPVDTLFGGTLTESYECQSCGHNSQHETKFFELNLAVPAPAEPPPSSFTVPSSFTGLLQLSVSTVAEQQPSPALQHLIDKYFEEETLDGENKYHCDNCEGLREAVKRTSIPEDRAPQNLIVSLKRFKYEATKGLRVKLLSPVECGEGIRLTTSAGEVVSYSLHSVVVHYGNTMEGGHYYACVRLGPDSWSRISDNLVFNQQASAESLVFQGSHTPYVLFFERETELDFEPSDEGAASQATTTISSASGGIPEPVVPSVLQQIPAHHSTVSSDTSTTHQ